MLLEFIINKEFQQVYIKVDVTNANGVYAFFYNDKQVINEILVSNTKTANNFLSYVTLDVYPKQRWYIQERI